MPSKKEGSEFQATIIKQLAYKTSLYTFVLLALCKFTHHLPKSRMQQKLKIEILKEQNKFKNTTKVVAPGMRYKVWYRYFCVLLDWCKRAISDVFSEIANLFTVVLYPAKVRLGLQLGEIHSKPSGGHDAGEVPKTCEGAALCHCNDKWKQRVKANFQSSPFEDTYYYIYVCSVTHWPRTPEYT